MAVVGDINGDDGTTAIICVLQLVQRKILLRAVVHLAKNCDAKQAVLLNFTCIGHDSEVQNVTK